MKCKILELGERDGWYPDKELFIGLEGELVEDDVLEIDEETGWARGFFWSDADITVHFPVFFADVRVELE